MLKVFIGYDKDEEAAALVAEHSIKVHASQPVDVQLLDMRALRNAGLYWRTSWAVEARQRYDSIDHRPFSTEFSFTRFLVPALMQYRGWALFVDSDVMFRTDVKKIFDGHTHDSSKALMCVKHDYHPPEGVKMRGDLRQTPYFRKNWSSVMLFNCGHEANWFLTPHTVNTSVGRDLQQMFWLRDNEIGDLPESWNWLVNYSNPEIEPHIVHFTLGTPDVPEHADVAFASEWWSHFGALKDSVA